MLPLGAWICLITQVEMGIKETQLLIHHPKSAQLVLSHLKMLLGCMKSQVFTSFTELCGAFVEM